MKSFFMEWIGKNGREGRVIRAESKKEANRIAAGLAKINGISEYYVRGI